MAMLTKAAGSWLGAGGGILASIGTAVALRVFFRSILGDVDPDLLEGITGLVAAGLLVYVSLWLHRQSSAGAWKTYLEDQTTSVLEASNLLPLALIAFLSVYREGAETILLYVGMAPSISPSDLWSGLGMGSALLVLIAVLMLGLGLRVPLRPFFRGTSILIYLLGFKFIGNGIHNLQEVGRIPLHVAAFLPTLKKLGIYPTWETALAQVALVGITISLLLWMRRDPSLQRSTDPSI
ncbi:MAG: iron permease [Synechococcaceae cyanobacterium RM1_1_27]|nr:iron permease [Synechococcaceae cyanobacterium RM1_1_27]